MGCAKHFLVVPFLLVCAACQTVHVHDADDDLLPIAMWSSIETVARNRNGAAGSSEREIVQNVLARHGIVAVVSGAGISVWEEDQDLAREIPLTDQRLADTDVIVILGVRAGTARETESGFEIPSLTPTD